ncbi:MAG: hypothetical protein GX633_09905 [Clostridiales bacterium]|nr:hypothetical protein [Clostridiales bacterium]
MIRSISTAEDSSSSNASENSVGVHRVIPSLMAPMVTQITTYDQSLCSERYAIVSRRLFFSSF